MAQAGPIVPANYTLIPTTSSGSNTTTASGAQTGWRFTTGSASVNDAHWSNGSLYYFGYMLDGSYTFNTSTGVWSGTSNTNAINGYLSNTADTVTVSMAFNSPQNVGMMRFYPSGWTGFIGTDYAVSYHDGTSWRSVLSQQGVDVAAAVEEQTFQDNTFAPVTAQQWRITLTNGNGGWNNNATFGEIQFFSAAAGNSFWAPGSGGGGGGIWSVGETNWAPAAGQQGTSAQIALGTLVFGDTAGTVTVSGSVSSSAGMHFSTDGYVITGGSAIALTGNSPTVNTITTETGVGTTIDSVLTGSNGFNKEGGGTLTLGGTNTYTGGTRITAGHLVGNASSLRGPISNSGTVTFNQATSGTLSGAVSGAGMFIKQGAAALTISLTGTNDFSNSLTISTGTLEFGGTGALTATDYTNPIVNNGTLVYSSTASQTLAGNITGSGDLIKSGAGTLLVTGSNTYGGVTRINSGELSIDTLTNAGVAGATGTNSTIVMSGGRLSYTGATASTNRIMDLSGASGEIAVATASTTLTVAGSIGNSGALVKSGAGTLMLSGSNTYTGPSVVHAGLLQFANKTSLYGGGTASWVQGNINVASGATVAINVGGTDEFSGSDVTTLLTNLASSTSSNTGLNGGATIGFDTSNAASGSFTVSDAISNTTGVSGGPLGLVKLGSGTLTLGGTNSYTGGTRIAAGHLVGNAASVRGPINNSGTVTFNEAANAIFSAAVSGTGMFVKEGASTLTISLTGTNDFSNSITIRSGTLEFGGTGYLNATDFSGGIVNNGALVYSSTATQTLSGTISGSGRLFKNGPGTLTLTKANTFGGATTINGGVLSVNSLPNAGVAGPTGTNSTIFISDAKLSYTGGNASTNRNIDLSGTSGEIAIASGAATLTIAGTLGNSGALVKSGIGTLALSASNSRTGATSLMAGTLALANVNALRNSTLDTGTVGTQAVTFTASGTNTYVIGGLRGTDGLAIGANSLSVGGNGSSTTYSGTIGGTGGLAKTGTGTLTLSGSSTYSGATTISGGRLEVGPTGLINATSGITINGGSLRYNAPTALGRPLSFSGAGGTLSGTGAIAVAVTAGTGAVLSPGNSPGTQAFTSGLTWAPGGSYDWELNALSGTAGVNWDLVNVTAGGLNLGGLSTSDKFMLNLITLTGSNTFGPLATVYVPGNTYEFMIAGFNSLSVPIGFSSGANSDLTELFAISLAGWQGPQPNLSDFSVRVNSAGTGISIGIVQAVPEPGALVLAGFGIAMTGWSAARLRRRRRAG